MTFSIFPYFSLKKKHKKSQASKAFQVQKILCCLINIRNKKSRFFNNINFFFASLQHLKKSLQKNLKLRKFGELPPWFSVSWYLQKFLNKRKKIKFYFLLWRDRLICSSQANKKQRTKQKNYFYSFLPKNYGKNQKNNLRKANQSRILRKKSIRNL